MNTSHHWINGQKISEATSYFDSISPVTGDVLARVPVADKNLLEKAISGAQQAQTAWAALSPMERGRVLRKAADLLREHNQRLAELEVADTGKPIQEADCVDILSGADCLEYYGSIIAGDRGAQIDLGNNFAYTRREPLGVCLGIGAWNYPLQIACWKAAPCLAAGNALIFKPSEMTPLTAPELGPIFKEAGLPDGLFQVVHGDAEVGKALVEHNGICKVSLTGEVNTGKKVMAAAAGSLKKVTFELGGKSPLIIFDDADLNNAVSASMVANFYTQGEICSNGTRVFVQRDCYNAFLEQLTKRTEKLVIGDPMDPATQIGALISEDHLTSVANACEKGVTGGARLVTGGKRASDLKGAFFQPTIFADCEDGMWIMQNEIFGPVMCVTPFDTEDEVIARANDTPYGLAAGVFTRDLARGHRVVHALQAGTCWINNYNITPIEMPFGAYKQSGMGRENGWEALEAYTQVKSVYVELGDVESPYE
ncbi:NAD/NADP-dependent betaine aldehyde dehydrogenase [Oceaniferula spumae]|uniref:NAD/NADP-dependent betaine aldehyde dehydrogenase n=1 Tax=Oceaniferula spumae TaxID=2979115 RepID=A0AAT9FJ89_9BACT